MPLTSSNYASLLEPGLRRRFSLAMSRPSPQRERLFGQVSSTKRTEHYQGIGAQGLVPPFNGTVEYRDFNNAYKTAILNYQFALGISVERELIDDEMYNEINSRATSLGDSVAVTLETDAADVFNNAFTDSGTNRYGQSTNGADAVALLSTAHPQSPANTGSTQSNEGTLALSHTAVDTTRQLMMNYTDDQGELLGVAPDLLLVPPELEQTARMIADSAAVYKPGSAEFNVNIFAGRIEVITWNRLTDSDAWFFIDSNLMRQHLIWQWRIRPEFAQQGDFDGLTAKYRTYMRYGIGWDDWRWIHGQNAS